MKEKSEFLLHKKNISKENTKDLNLNNKKSSNFSSIQKGFLELQNKKNGNLKDFGLGGYGIELIWKGKE